MSKTKREILLILILMSITIYLITHNLEIEQLKQLFFTIDLKYVFQAFDLLFIFWGLEAVMIGWLIKRVKRKHVPKKLAWIAVKTTLIGQYYANITPFASGGQPAQLLVLQKYDVQTSEGTAVLVAKFLIFQLTVTFYAMILFALGYRTIPRFTIPFVMVGLVVNLIGLTLIVLGAFEPKHLARWVTWVLSKFKRSNKKFNRLSQKIKTFTTEYKTGMLKLVSDKRQASILFILSIIQLTVFFSIPFKLSEALGVSDVSYFQMLTFQAILYMAVSFIPIPGTVGVSEFGFVALLGQVMTQHVASVLMLLWRFVSYYFSLIFCGVFSLITTVFAKRTVRE